LTPPPRSSTKNQTEEENMAKQIDDLTAEETAAALEHCARTYSGGCDKCPIDDKCSGDGVMMLHAAALLRQQAAPAEAGPMPWVELALRLLELQPLDYRFRAKGAASNWASDLAQDTDLLIAEYRKRQAGA